jgi:CysZ protein
MMSTNALPSEQPRTVKLGFGDGFTALWEGVQFVFRPKNWGLAFVPAAVAIGLMTILGIGATFAGHAIGDLVASSGDAWYHSVLRFVLKALFMLLGLALAFLIAFALAQPISGFALDGLSRRQERELGGPERPGHSGVANFLRTLKCTFLGLAVAIAIIAPLSLLSLSGVLAIVAVPLKLYVAALCVTWDFLDYPLGLRGVDLGDRVRWVRHNFAAVSGMAVAAGCVLLVPGLALLLLPAGVVGATRLVMKTERC